jgi:hypothetical protein
MTQIKVVSEQGAERKVLTYAGRRNRGMEKIP